MRNQAQIDGVISGALSNTRNIHIFVYTDVLSLGTFNKSTESRCLFRVNFEPTIQTSVQVKRRSLAKTIKLNKWWG